MSGELDEPIAWVETDALVIGAGPVGLFQVFELGLLDIHAHVIDVLPHVGGQCIELYADKPIYDIPGIPRCTGRELIDRLMSQAAPFQPTFHLGQLVSSVRRHTDGRWAVSTDQSKAFLAKTVFIAGGVGAFSPKRLRLDGLENIDPHQVRYQMSQPEAYAGLHVAVMGDGDAALSAALTLLSLPKPPRTLTLVHRRDTFSAQATLVAAMRQAVADGAMTLAIAQATGLQATSGKMTDLLLTDTLARTNPIPCDRILVLQGLSPKLGPIADWGLAMERKQLAVDTEQFSTSETGIFAVGDINTYPGKKKLILCGFHEATLAAFGAAALVFPETKVMLQYTTSSSKLQTLLGVSASGN